KLYKVSRAEYWNSIDTGLRKYISLLVRKDFSNKGKEIYAKVLDENIITLDSVVRIYGYPGEHLIGVWDDQTINRQTDCHYLSSIPSIIFWHHQCGYPLMKKALIKALKDGELNPREYAMTYEWAFNVAKRNKFVENNREKFGALLKTHN